MSTKYLKRYLVLLFLVVVMILRANMAYAASAVVVFAPGCKYISKNFHYIAKFMFGQYFDDLLIGEDVDEEYSHYSYRSQNHFDENFAYDKGYDYLISIYIGHIGQTSATHINAHTGQRTPLSTGSVSTSMVTADAASEPVQYYNESASFQANRGFFTQDKQYEGWDNFDQSFIRNLKYLIEQHYKVFWRKRGISRIRSGEAAVADMDEESYQASKQTKE